MKKMFVFTEHPQNYMYLPKIDLSSICVMIMIINIMARSLVVSDLCLETEGSGFGFGRQLCAEVSCLQ